MLYAITMGRLNSAASSVAVPLAISVTSQAEEAEELRQRRRRTEQNEDSQDENNIGLLPQDRTGSEPTIAWPATPEKCAGHPTNRVDAPQVQMPGHRPNFPTFFRFTQLLRGHSARANAERPRPSRGVLSDLDHRSP